MHGPKPSSVEVVAGKSLRGNHKPLDFCALTHIRLLHLILSQICHHFVAEGDTSNLNAILPLLCLVAVVT